MTKHDTCTHAATPAARAKCRKARAAGDPTIAAVVAAVNALPSMKAPKPEKLRFNQTAHCSSCGNTDAEDVDPWNAEREGYTGCCNKRISYTCRTDNCHHA